MIEELNLKCPYKIYKSTDHYFFITDSGIKYILYFTSVNYFGNFILDQNVYEFGFETENGIRSADKKVKSTVLAFINEFFKTKENVLYYVADISEMKQKARNRLFDIWKNSFDTNNDFLKFDMQIIDDDDESYFSSMVLRSDNVFCEEYKKAFLNWENEKSGYR